MYEIQFNRHDGPDESFEARTIAEANRIIKDEKTPGTWKIVVISLSTGKVVYES